jgi:hypothetical protein
MSMIGGSEGGRGGLTGERSAARRIRRSAGGTRKSYGPPGVLSTKV